MMMKLFLAFLFCLLAIPAWASESAYERVIESGTLRCGYALSAGTTEVDANTGKMSGSAYDIIEEIGKQLGLKIEWAEEAGWGNFIEGLRNNRFDAFCSLMWPDAARMKYLAVTRPVVYSQIAAYVRADDTRFDGNAEALYAKGIKIPAIDGDVSSTMIRDLFPQAETFTLPQMGTLSDMAMAVITKKADFLMLDANMFKAYNANNPGALRKIDNIDPIMMKGSNFGVLAGEYQIRDMMNAALSILINDGKIDAILAKYEGLTPPAKGYSE